MKRVTERKNDDGQVIWKINARSKKGEYRILKGNQAKYCSIVRLDGFDKLPAGFYTNDGFGLTAGGNFLLQEIHDRFGKKVDLVVNANGLSRVDGRGRTTKVTIRHSALLHLNGSVRAVKRKRNEELRAEVQNFLGNQFRQFHDYKGARPRYAAGTLAETLDYEGIVERLSPEDRERIEGFIPEYLSKITGTLKAKKKLQVIYDSLDAGKKVYLGKVLREFRNKLKRRVQNEHIWQVFLSEYILILRNTYGSVLEKASVSLQGKFPDFMLIDPYGYLDIYEIKKPSTVLLRHDKSRNNYYWDAEVSKAIAQVENYLHQVQRHSDALVNDIRRNKGIDVKIVRPRGYIIAGTRAQLKTDKMVDDCRILNESLRNIDVIFYDDLLNNLETFVERVA